MPITLQDLKEAFTLNLESNLLGYFINNGEEINEEQKKIFSELLIPYIEINKEIFNLKNNEPNLLLWVEFINSLEEEGKGILIENNYVFNNYIYSSKKLEEIIENNNVIITMDILTQPESAENILKTLSRRIAFNNFEFKNDSYLRNDVYQFLNNVYANNAKDPLSKDFMLKEMLVTDDMTDMVFLENKNKETNMIMRIMSDYDIKKASDFMSLMTYTNEFLENFMVIKEEIQENSLFLNDIKEKLMETLDNNTDLTMEISNILEETVYINGILNLKFAKEISKRLGEKYSSLIIAHSTSDLSNMNDDSFLLRYAIRRDIADNKLNTRIRFSETDINYTLSLENNTMFYLLQDFILADDSNLIDPLKGGFNFQGENVAYRIGNKNSFFVFNKHTFKGITEEQAINMVVECFSSLVHQTIEDSVFIRVEGKLSLSEMFLQSYRKDYLLEKIDEKNNQNTKAKKKV